MCPDDIIRHVVLILSFACSSCAVTGNRKVVACGPCSRLLNTPLWQCKIDRSTHQQAFSALSLARSRYPTLAPSGNPEAFSSASPFGIVHLGWADWLRGWLTAALFAPTKSFPCSFLLSVSQNRQSGRSPCGHVSLLRKRQRVSPVAILICSRSSRLFLRALASNILSPFSTLFGPARASWHRLCLICDSLHPECGEPVRLHAVTDQKERSPANEVFYLSRARTALSAVVDAIAACHVGRRHRGAGLNLTLLHPPVCSRLPCAGCCVPFLTFFPLCFWRGCFVRPRSPPLRLLLPRSEVLV